MNENEYMLQGSVIKKFTFVLMPFRDDFNNIYQFGIKAACQAEGVYCERVDEQYYEGSILDRIYNQIQHADYIVADMSTRSPNVFYEVGFAHALQKSARLRCHRARPHRATRPQCSALRCAAGSRGCP